MYALKMLVLLSEGEWKELVGAHGGAWITNTLGIGFGGNLSVWHAACGHSGQTMESTRGVENTLVAVAALGGLSACDGRGCDTACLMDLGPSSHAAGPDPECLWALG